MTLRGVRGYGIYSSVLPTQLCIIRKASVGTTLTLPLHDTIIVIQTHQSPGGPARQAPLTNPEADARGWSAPPQPRARRSGESRRHASLPVSGAPVGRYRAHGRSRGSLGQAPRQKARRPRRGATAAWRARGAGTLARPSVWRPNTYPGPRGCPHEIFVAKAAEER